MGNWGRQIYLQRVVMLVGGRSSEQRVGQAAQGFKCCLRRSRKVRGSAVVAITMVPRRLALFSSRLLLSTNRHTDCSPACACCLFLLSRLPSPAPTAPTKLLQFRTSSPSEVAGLPVVSLSPSDHFSRPLSRHTVMCFALHAVVVCIDVFQAGYQTSHATD